MKTTFAVTVRFVVRSVHSGTSVLTVAAILYGCASLSPNLRLPPNADDAFKIEDRPVRNTIMSASVSAPASLSSGLTVAERALRSWGFEVRPEASTEDRRCGLYPTDWHDWPFWACFYFKQRPDGLLAGRVVIDSWKNFGVTTRTLWHLRLASAFQERIRDVTVAPTTRTEKPRTSRGTAFAVRPDGHFLTAFHVVEDAKAITISCPDRPPSSATILKAAKQADLAILRTDLHGLPYLPLDSRSMKIGDSVFTIGFPATAILGSGPKFTDGAVSSLSGPGDEPTLIQTTVPIQPGSSGGPLVDNVGRVIGTITSTAAIRPFLSTTGALPQNVNWAVKAYYAAPLFEAPPPLRDARDRAEAIERAIKATCSIEASH